MTIPDRLRHQLHRMYYFAEAMALYEAYYDPVRERISNPAGQDATSTPEGSEDRPLTWVPIVWHVTTFDAFKSIVHDGFIRAPVHLTELPIGEIDRIRIRLRKQPTTNQVAIGFPRRFLESKGITPVLYTKHNPMLREAIARDPEVAAALAPFVEPDNDTSSFLELRTLERLEVSNAVWLLTPRMEDEEGIKRLWVPGLEAFQEKWGRIALSYWGRERLLSELNCWMFLEIRRLADGSLREAIAIGDTWWTKHSYKTESHTVLMPAGRSFNLNFDPERSRRR